MKANTPSRSPSGHPFSFRFQNDGGRKNASPQSMTFAQFQEFARLYVVGALEDEELIKFEAGRELFGRRAEDYVHDCQKLQAVFALSLTPAPPARDAKARLMSLIRASGTR